MAATRATASTRASTGTRRLNINLPASVLDDVEVLAKEAGRTMTDFVRLALGLAKLALEAAKEGQSLYIGKDGKALREIIIPR
jgi:hypothetical protein